MNHPPNVEDYQCKAISRLTIDLGIMTESGQLKDGEAFYVTMNIFCVRDHRSSREEARAVYLEVSMNDRFREQILKAIGEALEGVTP
jgi:hypothetical protein